MAPTSLVVRTTLSQTFGTANGNNMTECLDNWSCCGYWVIFLTLCLQCKIKLITLRRKNGKIYQIIELI